MWDIIKLPDSLENKDASLEEKLTSDTSKRKKFKTVRHRVKELLRKLIS